MPRMMNNDETKKPALVSSTGCVVVPCVNQNNNDKLVQQLLKKLDEGSETILNLRSLLTLKTAELNQLISQLELIDQVLANVENGTEHIESVLKDVLSSKNQHDKLLNAEATLDSAIKSACSLYSIELYSVSSKQEASPPLKTASAVLMDKIADVLDELNIKTTIDLYKNDDIKVLQKAYMDLDLAKTIAASIRADFKHRSTLLKKKHSLPVDKIKQLGSHIRKQVEIYRLHTRDAPFIVYGKEDIITILDREDHSIASRKIIHNTTNKQQQQQPTRIFCSTANALKKQQSATPSPSMKLKSRSTVNTTTTKSTLQMISRPTLTFMAKCKEKKAMNNGPGSTLRLRNMLAKRNPALKMMNEQMMIGSTVC